MWEVIASLTTYPIEPHAPAASSHKAWPSGRWQLAIYLSAGKKLSRVKKPLPSFLSREWVVSNDSLGREKRLPVG
jgi:hypothetical protein